MTTANGPPRLRDRTILVLTTALFALPVVIDLWLSPPSAAFRYSAPDAFYYHTIARNWAHTGLPGYDGIHPVNGFHPGWQLTLAGCYRLSRQLGLPELTYVYGSLALGIIAISAAIILIGLAWKRSRRRLPAGFLLLPVGAYALCIAPYWLIAVDWRQLEHGSQGPFPLFGTLWSYVNGMESGLVLAAWAGLAFTFMERGGRRRALKLGCWAAALCLARLDHGVFALPLWVYFGRRASRRKDRQSINDLLTFSLCFALPIVAYLALNQAYAGVALPVSGSAKTTFPAINTSQLENVLHWLRQPLTDGRSMSAFYRFNQLLIPALSACIALWMMRRRDAQDTPGSQWHTLLRLTAWGVLGLAGYNFFFVDAFATGHWYVPVSTLFVSLFAITCLDRPEALRARQRRLALVLALSSLGIFWFLHRRPSYHWLYAQMYLVEGPEARDFYARQPPKLLEMDDGIIAFATGFPTMSGTALALDLEAVQAQRKGRLMPLALERGFDRSSSLVYRLPPNAYRRGHKPPGRRGAQAHIDRFVGPRRADRYETEYISTSGYFWIVRYRHEQAEPAGKRKNPAARH